MRKKKKTGKILLIILLLIVVLLAALAFWQRDNLKALYQAWTMDADAILADAEVKSEIRQKELEAYGVTLKVPTREEMDALLNGEAVPTGADITLEQNPASPDAAEPGETDPDAAVQTENEAETEQTGDPKDIIERCIQELYDCETALMARLGEMKQAAIDEWKALPDAERTREKKLEIGRRGLDDCYKLEVEIDAQVQGILDRYRAELEAAHTDTAPMDTLWAHYCEEKTSTKAYYFNKYL